MRVIDAFKFGSGGAVDPTTIAGLSFWVEASAISGVDGDLISSWNDQTAGAKHITASGSLRPTLKTGILNGLPVVRFNGSNRLINSAFSLAQPQTVIAVAKRNTTGVILDSYNSTQHALYYGTGGDEPGKVASNAGGVVMSSAIDTGFHFIRVTYNGASSSLAVDGTVVASGSSGTNGLNGLSVGNLRGNPSPLAGDYALTGDIALILIYNGVLSSGDLSYLYSGYKARYALL